MDAGPPSSNTISSGSGQQASRKERGAIAAQACETCRNRKQKCDEQRPKCGTCQRFKLECRYREPQPTKKDKTLVEILDRLKSLENKVDGLVGKGGIASPMFGATQSTAVFASSSATPLVVDSDAQESHPASSVPPPSPSTTHNGGQYAYASSVSRMLEWPAVRHLFENVGHKLQSMPRGLHGSTASLPLDGLQSIGIADNALRVLQFAGSRSGLEMNAPTIDWETMQRLSKSYFDTFNFLHPILDRHWFNSNTLTSIINTGFQDSTTSALVLLVLALGEVALTASGVPISVHKGRQSGIKGGTLDRPPGVAYFNEARKRMGFVLTEVSLENVQMFALASLYFDSCGQALECWRMSISASLACQALITSKPNELHGPHADNVRRIYWHCVMIETYLHMEFDLPLTGLEKLDNVVLVPDFTIPDFNGPINEDYIINQTTHFQEHFTVRIFLRRLTASLHSALGAFGAGPSLPFPGMGSFSSSSGDSNPSTMRHLASQLDHWRRTLPGPLQWQDEQSMALMDPSPDAFSPVYGGFIPAPDLDAPPATYPNVAYIQAALLRTRYYYHKYLVYRPFVFKVLHHPESITREDAEGAAECLKAALKWPIAMPPPCTNKRLVPATFFWSQNMFGILVLLRLSQQHSMLNQICSSFCGQGFQVEADETINLYVDWLRDLKKIDSTAERCWGLARLLYGLDD